MANTIKLGNGNWATKEGSLLAYNDENNNFKPLPFTTTRASSATVVNKQGLIETVGSGIPRIDFSDDANGALLLEPQSSNLVVLSNDFSGLAGGYVTPNYGTSQQGLSVSRVLFTAANQSLSAATSLATGVVCNFSAYVKGVQGELIRFAAGGADVSHTFSGEWERLSGSKTSVNSSWNFNTYGSATARDFLMCAAQLEEGSYATSYIKTVGTAQTRVADTASGSGNSTVINSTEGVLYAEISALANDSTNRKITLNNGNYTNQISLSYGSSSNLIDCLVYDGTVQANLTYSSSIIKDFNKIAFKYKSNNFSLWVNGIKVASTLLGVTTSLTLSAISFNNGGSGDVFYGKTKDLRVYTTALTDAELTTLTTI